MRPGNIKHEDLKPLTVKKFHQFVKIERGPVNSAIIDLLRGQVFHVQNETVDRFNAGELDSIQEFINVLEEEKMILNIEPFRWIPEIDLGSDIEDDNEVEKSIELHLDDGVDIRKILISFEDYPISRIFYYGAEIPAEFQGDARIELKEKSFNECVEQSSINGSFCEINESMVRFNRCFNSCWGDTISITTDGKIRPCIHSLIEIGHIESDLQNIDSLIEKMQPYWEYNKDKVERCRDCEFRYVCFDCREIAMRKSGEMNSRNPLCDYNPYTGEWEEENAD